MRILSTFPMSEEKPRRHDSALTHRAWWPVSGTCSWSQRSSAAGARSWSGWRACSAACKPPQSTCSRLPATGAGGPPRFLQAHHSHTRESSHCLRFKSVFHLEKDKQGWKLSSMKMSLWSNLVQRHATKSLRQDWSVTFDQ